MNVSPKIIALTGGIGSGKSTVAEIFKVLSVKVFDSDFSAKQVYFKETIKSKVIELLGIEAYLNENTINKKYISSKIFSETHLLQQLNNIIHPEVKAEFSNWVSEHKTENYLIKESALVFETDIHKNVNAIITVVSPLQTRILRVSKRDGLSEDDVRLKINNQMSDEEKIKRSDFVIYNDDEHSLINQCLELHRLLTEK